MSIVDPCDCGLHPEIREIKTTTYVAMCPCGNHGPVMQLREWAISEWNSQASDADQVGARLMNPKVKSAGAA